MTSSAIFSASLARVCERRRASNMSSLVLSVSLVFVFPSEQDVGSLHLLNINDYIDQSESSNKIKQ